MTAALDAPAASANGFLALPFRPALAGEAITIERAKTISRILRGVASHESLFTDYERVCDARCFACPRCLARLARVTAMLTAPDARVWEVWRTDSPDESGLDVVGILYVTDLVYGSDAACHYVFFDDDLRGKTPLLEAMIQWLFSDHEDASGVLAWRALRRLTISVPDYAYALALHASRKLGFGGPFEYEIARGGRPRTIPVEGVKRRALRWRGQDRDLLLLGRLAESET